jgi:hypothetical protein
MPRVVKKSVESTPAPIAPVAPAHVAPAHVAPVEPTATKAGVRFGKMSEEHKTKLADHKDASKHFKASLRGNLMIGRTYEDAVERAKAHDTKVKARAETK